MAVDLEYRLSGGAANANPLLSLGGAMSSVEVVGSTIFDTVIGAESTAGSVEYRCIYVYNNGDPLYGAKVYFTANTPSADTVIAVALDDGGKNTTPSAVANETTSPGAEAFSSPSTLGTGLSLGDLANTDRFAIWLRRTVTAGAASAPSDTFTLSVGYDY